MASLIGNPARLSAFGKDVLVEVREAHRAGRLGFLAGAGLSSAIGLPPWNLFNEALVQHSLAYHAQPGRDVEDSIALARAYLEQLHGQSLAAVDFARRMAGSEFHRVLRRALYERPALKWYHPTEVHYALAALAVSARPPFPCIHTTNYDDLLERALAVVAGGAEPAGIASLHSGNRRLSDGPRIVHLHGYFPFKLAPGETEGELSRTLVASEADYHTLANDHSAWTNRELLSLLETRSALIVGMSLTDPNVRRLLAHLSQQRPPSRHGGRESHYVIMQYRVPDRSSDGAAAGAVPDDSHSLASRASAILDSNERAFWEEQGVKILRIDNYDRLGYLMRRIRFDDAEWDEAHRRARAMWAERNYGAIDFDDPGLQELLTMLLGKVRDRLTNGALPFRLSGRVELNVFLPLVDGSCRRAFSSVRGRATFAPRCFEVRHDRFSLPDLERVLVVGEPITTRLGPPREVPEADPPFDTWYRSIEGMPYFDRAAGGMPVAVIQLCSSVEGGVGRDLETAQMAELRDYLGSVISRVLDAVREVSGWRPPPRS